MTTTDAGLQCELDELLGQGRSSPPAPPKTKPQSDFDDLDDLLKESVAIRDEAAATKGMRERLKKGKISSTERHEIEAKVREWESRNVWDTKATVAVFEKVSCDCGFYTEVFSHLMLRQVHKHTPATTRLVVTEDFDSSFPQEVAKQISNVFICAECGPGKGWDIDNAEVLEWQA